MTEDALLSVENLTKHFPVTRGVLGRQVGTVRAVDGLSFEIGRGETLGLVGESGCGKTTAGRALLRLIEPTSGTIRFNGKELTGLGRRELRAERRDMQIIFQDPFSSLNPRMRVRDIVGEALVTHGIVGRRELDRRVGELLEKVGVTPRFANRYAHEFSGGQRQRIGIARAIALEPKFIVCDEAVSALDVSIRAQVINLLIALRAEFGLSYLFISHDLSVVKHISNRIAVMYLGQIVELADADELFRVPGHPYTRSLLSAIPLPDPRQRQKRKVLSGDVPTPLNPPSGCRFHTRCPAAFDRCPREEPQLLTLPGGHRVSCHHADGLESETDWFTRMDRRIREQEATNERARQHLEPAEALPEKDETHVRRVELRAERAGGLAHGREAPPGDSPWVGPRAARALVLGGLAIVVAGHWFFGTLMSLAAYLAFMRPRLSRALPFDLGLAFALVMTLMVGRALIEQSEATEARLELRGLSKQVAAYRRNVGELPDSLQALGWRLFEVLPNGTPIDPWGRPYSLTRGSPGKPAAVVSQGPDETTPADDLRVTVAE